MRRKTIPPLRKGATDAEVIRWTKKYDVFDRLGAGVSEVVEDHSDLDRVLQEALFQDNTAQLNMRIPPAMKAVLSTLARQSGQQMRPPLPASGLLKGFSGN